MSEVTIETRVNGQTRSVITVNGEGAAGAFPGTFKELRLESELRQARRELREQRGAREEDGETEASLREQRAKLQLEVVEQSVTIRTAYQRGDDYKADLNRLFALVKPFVENYGDAPRGKFNDKDLAYEQWDALDDVVNNEDGKGVNLGS